MEGALLEEYQEALRDLLLYIYSDAGQTRANQRGAGCRVLRFLPQLVDIVAEALNDPSMSEREAIRAQICSGCEYQDANGYCPLRTTGECCLSREEGRVLAVIRRVMQSQGAERAEEMRPTMGGRDGGP